MCHSDWLAHGHMPILELKSLVNLIKPCGFGGVGSDGVGVFCKSTVRVQLTEQRENAYTAPQELFVSSSALPNDWYIP